MSTVAELLQQSRAAHDAYRMALPRYEPQSGQTTPGDREAAASHLQRAFDLRAEAENADVAGDSPIWADEAATHPHYALLSFYDAQEPSVKALLVAPVRELPPIVGTPMDEVKVG